MKKLLALISSVSVCSSAVAVSVLSYFPHPSETNAEGTPSSLVTTPIEDTGTFPVITFPKSVLVNATSDRIVELFFCPTGWSSGYSFVSPSSFGTYSSSSFIKVTFYWVVSKQFFKISASAHFDTGLSGQSVFSCLNLYNPDGSGGLPSLHLLFSSVSPWSDASTFTIFDFTGNSITPSSLVSDNVVFQLSGLLGNDYESSRYSEGYDKGLADGYGDGHSDGYSDGHSDGYTEGHDAGINDKDHNTEIYGEGYTDGHADGLTDGDASGYARGVADGSSNFGMWDLFSNAFGSVANILNIQLFPGFSLGLLLSVPIAFSFLLWLIHVLKG